ncbi:nicotinate-nucleotide--dimethylbenzimidazole phosphoribosyltransferase [Candidatus Methylomirabilis limnetica]|uniref:Nicotinate-nucleotide--dimethylbenzimidazole phosphoribosyltransferase n=1 Tax=Candidatus Methylomirabilis limnetica TaxID=2033718 RepID=A0A2T4TX13_9BACT|nr:nicotinate-nucleotide--dimethylbenzimidazole phosphoribosyltransferase [Candidatus Methylomirabilis limnetica]PTL35637.1 nicotinate-nucleotide--dimethylbenzimidazole phosphoribosyltransferase [Candidatus Methylomirabilis limnetica]
MSKLTEICSRIREPDHRIAEATQRLLDIKTKPRRSLGRLEDLACQVAAIRGTNAPDPPQKAIVVMGADHGVAEEGVSAYPQEVTGQMLLNFARGGAAINVLARHAGARVVVVDMGVKAPLSAAPEIRAHRIGSGTHNFTKGPAMTREEAIAAVEVGIQIAEELVRDGVTLLGIGDMGIGNTTAASALAAVFTGAPPEDVAGRGTGIDDVALKRKVDVIRRGLSVNRPDPQDGVDALAKVGGFEIAGLAGVILGGAASGIAIVVDGFICGTAALAATRIAPVTAEHLIASHRSAEVGHRLVLQALGTTPLFDLNLRLGEGTGAVLAMNLVEAALCILREMATFTSAGVSDSGA